MSRPKLMICFGFTAVFALSFTASAQDSALDVPSESGPAMVTMASGQQSPSTDGWLQENLEDAKLRSRRARNALIATSVVTGVGAALLAVGISQCQLVSTFGQQDELLCNNSGYVLPPLGGTIGGLGAIGMIASGIVLGMSNKRKREIQGHIREAQHGRRLQWDIPRGVLTF